MSGLVFSALFSILIQNDLIMAETATDSCEVKKVLSFE